VPIPDGEAKSAISSAAEASKSAESNAGEVARKHESIVEAPFVPGAAGEGTHQNHPFFHFYGLLPHQQNMMQDTVRTGTYYKAFMSNPTDFRGKVVLDVGTGSGILAYFAVRAGARKVYAVEASGVAEHARKLLQYNGLGDRIHVIRGKIEEVEIPEKVDVLISEPMGVALLHERMIESYLIGRDRFLKPGGKLMPSNGTIFVAPFTD